MAHSKKPGHWLRLTNLGYTSAVEASSRSLKSYSEESISDLVERIIDNKITEGLFKDVPITFRDLERLKRVFKAKLITIYHTRIEYPELPSVIQPPVTE